jgi:hypothetical protein
MASLLLSPALSDAATLTGADTSGDLTIANLQSMQPGEVTRFASLGSMYAVYDLGAAYPISYVWQRSPNVTSAGTVRTRAATSLANLTAVPGYDSAALAYWTASGAADWPYHDNHLDLLTNPKTFRYWRFDWADAANPDSYLDLSRLYLSVAFEPATGSFGLESVGPTQAIARVVSQGSQVYPAVRPTKNTMAIRIYYVSRAQALGGIYELGRTRGTALDIVAIYDSADLAYLQHLTCYGLADEPYLLTNESVKYWDAVMKITEL